MILDKRGTVLRLPASRIYVKTALRDEEEIELFNTRVVHRIDPIWDPEIAIDIRQVLSYQLPSRSVSVQPSRIMLRPCRTTPGVAVHR